MTGQNILLRLFLLYTVGIVVVLIVCLSIATIYKIISIVERVFIAILPCGPGTYFDTNDSLCKTCPDGLYQNGANNTACNECPYGLLVSKDKTSCTDLCPPGYLFLNDHTPCVPCTVDHYWTSIHSCEPCPENTSTHGQVAATKCISLSTTTTTANTEAPSPVHATHTTGKDSTKDAMLFVLTGLLFCSLLVTALVIWILCRRRTLSQFADREDELDQSTRKEPGKRPQPPKPASVYENERVSPRDIEVTYDASNNEYEHLDAAENKKTEGYYNPIDIGLSPHK